MKVLVIGSGGREHALAWKLAASPRVSLVVVAPGNGGTAQMPKVRNVAITEVVELVRYARSEEIALTVVGPEGPLALGVVDAFRAQGLAIVGPTAAAAQLESSKAFAKDFMHRHGIPTAGYQVFSDAVAAHAYVDQRGAPIVIKADGLASGKGVVVATSVAQAHAAIDALGQEVGGGRIVVEDFLQGQEASFMVLCDGKTALALATSQDHKRLQDGDLGPNTGGMGAYSPAPVVTPAIHAQVMQRIIEPTIAGLAREGVVFTGFLYAGLMIGPDGTVKTLEFNTRLGDPETQPILMRLQTDLCDVLLACAQQALHTVQLQWDARCALGVVMAARGYPQAPQKGDVITGLPAPSSDAVVFHAGTALNAQGQVVTAGGRVLCVTALGAGVQQAQARAYEVLAPIQFEGAQWRHDIGYRAISV